jgi:hypothetical protein
MQVYSFSQNLKTCRTNDALPALTGTKAIYLKGFGLRQQPFQKLKKAPPQITYRKIRAMVSFLLFFYAFHSLIHTLEAFC